MADALVWPRIRGHTAALACNTGRLPGTRRSADAPDRRCRDHGGPADGSPLVGPQVAGWRSLSR